MVKYKKIIRFGYHTLFWILVFIFFVYLFNWNSDFKEVSRMISLGLLPVVMAVTYFLNYWLIPRYFWEKRYGKFILFAFYTFLFGVWLSFVIVFYTLMHVIVHRDAVDPGTLHPELQVLSMNFVVFFATAVNVLKRTLTLQQDRNRLEKRKLEIQLKLKEAELKLLKDQIHPHFLFNTLNNIYGLTLEKSDDAPELVLKLSEILDYILYRCNRQYVALSEEINNLENYIEVQKIRHAKNQACVAEFPGDTGKLRIAPLILLPFLENAFKHGLIHSSDAADVETSIHLSGEKMLFVVLNKVVPGSMGKSSGGIGIQNVTKRLDLIYPGKHKLEIDQSSNTFCVTLELTLTD